MNEPIYKPTFYRGHATGSSLSARLILPEVFEIVGLPSSVIDVGCGVATWGGVVRELGVSSYLGVDGDWVPVDQLQIPREQFMQADLSQLDCLQFDRQFDLAICLEVAEHLPESEADRLIKFLTAHADRILFGAATPRQGGTHHVNEQWQSYWADIFVNNGFDAFDIIRPRIAGNREIEYWYRQNTILYAKRDSGFATATARAAIPRALDYILPELYEDKLKQIEKPKLRDLIRRVPAALKNDIKRKFFKRSA